MINEMNWMMDTSNSKVLSDFNYEKVNTRIYFQYGTHNLIGWDLTYDPFREATWSCRARRVTNRLTVARGDCHQTPAA